MFSRIKNKLGERLFKPGDVDHSIDHKIQKYIENGKIPWSEGYHEYKWELIKRSLNDETLIDRFKTRKDLVNYGIGIDERIVEYPWMVSNLSDNADKLMDAGSALNFEAILNNNIIARKEKTILTFYPETPNFNERKISYIYADLRDIPFKDNYFDEIVCMSTLEHIDMDNTMYGYKESFNPNASVKSYDYLIAVDELVRVLKNQGLLLITFPFGSFENHGFFQQFDEEMVIRMQKKLLSTGSCISTFFRYTPDGWLLSEESRMY